MQVGRAAESVASAGGRGEESFILFIILFFFVEEWKALSGEEEVVTVRSRPGGDRASEVHGDWC